MTTIQDIRGYEPAEQNSTKQLRGDWQTLFAWNSKQVEGEEVKDSGGEIISASQVFSTAKRIFRELVRRGGTTFISPGEMDNRVSGRFFTRILRDVIGGDALYLEPPHGIQAYKGKEKLIVLKTKVTGHVLTPIYLESGDKCFGIIRLDFPKQMSLRTFKQQENVHGISDTERKRLWPRATSFWAYRFSFVVKFSKPVGIRTHPSDRQFLSGQKVVMKQLPIEELSDEELQDEIAHLHRVSLVASDEEREDLLEEYVVKSVAMRDRRLKDHVSDEMSRVFEEFYTAYAPVHSNTPKEGKGTKITLGQVMGLLESFEIRKPVVALVGGLAINGETEGDIDLLVRGSETMPPDIEVPIKFRIFRQFCGEADLAKRIHFLDDHFWGPFTSYVPIYALTGERVNPDGDVVQMSIEVHKAAVRARNPQSQMDAEWSKQHDKLRLRRFFYPLKTSLSIVSHRKAEVYSLNQAIEYMRRLAARKGVEWPICVVQKKYA